MRLASKLLAPSTLVLSSCVVPDMPLARHDQPDSRHRDVACLTDQPAYRSGEQVGIACTFASSPSGRPEALVEVVRLDRDMERSVARASVQSRGRSTAQLHWTPGPADAGHGYGVVVSGRGSAASRSNGMRTTFRVLAPGELTRFSIVRHDQPGTSLFDLDGGMSAEYALEKSVSGLAGGMSHSWRVSRSGHGPRPVFATREFLQKSVRETVAIYDRELGRNRTFDTVILSTGYPTIPYLSQALNAPVLPLHFLASADSVAEIRTALDGAISEGYSAYATLGHDPSVDHAVAWIKLLDLPAEYRAFLRRHRVRTVLITGSTGTSGGETKARKLGRDNVVSYAPGDIYVMYPGTSHSDEESLAEKIVDLQQQPELSDFVRITDWESGVAQSQACRIATSAASGGDTGSEILGLMPEDLGSLYSLGTTVTASLMAKNRSLFGDPSKPASGIVLNPYLMAYPGQEFEAGYIPIVYFQVVPAQTTLSKLQTVVAPALKKYFPERRLESARIWLNSSKNFGGKFFGDPYQREAARLGFKDMVVNDYTVDEQWAPNDGQRSISEKLAQAEASKPPPLRLSSMAAARSPLTMAEFKEVLTLHSDLRLTSLAACR